MRSAVGSHECRGILSVYATCPRVRYNPWITQIFANSPACAGNRFSIYSIWRVVRSDMFSVYRISGIFITSYD